MRGEIAVKAAPGVIDCLSEGFGLVTRHLWVTFFPIGLDVLLYLAPRITAQPLVEQFLASYRQAAAEVGDPSLVVGGADLQTVETFGRTFGEMNFLSFLGWNPAGAVVPSSAGLSTGVGATLTIASAGDFILLLLCVQLVGLFLGCLYLGVLGQLVRDGRANLRRLTERVGSYWLTFLAFILLLVGVALAVSLTIAVLAVVSLSLAAFLSAALTTAAFFIGLFLVIYLFFFTAAVVVGERGPLDGIRSSFQTVRGSFWPSIGLIALTLLIGQGMLVIWWRLAEAPGGVLLGVVGNAYVASGLTAATMYFYRSRALRAVAPPKPVVERGDDASR